MKFHKITVKKYLSFFIILIALVFSMQMLVSCDSSSSDDNSSDNGFNSYFPLQQGNAWDFVATTSDGQSTGKMEVKPNAEFAGVNSIPLELINTEDQSLNGKFYLDADSKKVDVLGTASTENTIIFDTKLRLFSFPLETGASWTGATSFTYEGVPVQINSATSVLGIDDITVQGKQYKNCYKLSSTISIIATIVIPIQVDVPVTMWLAENIGVVKIVANVPDLPVSLDIPTGEVTVEITNTNF